MTSIVFILFLRYKNLPLDEGEVYFFPSMLKDKLDVPPHVGDLAGHGRGSIAKYLSILFAP